LRDRIILILLKLEPRFRVKLKVTSFQIQFEFGY
jgi:hypothetical protein